MPELKRLERLHPECGSLAEALRASGTSWGDVGLTSEDGARLDEVFTCIDET
ncbi:hypothetical protein LE181_01695 [Streptomyces sp. SCA3-4]|uniref:hypothetical protein n=1 Tax=Streptomyces sichuanensis TaxID=2871810 RepID=UPI001CE2C530|nr:hypothetical protein [Streptomyces sichuanensis]MCA6090896.1 hypothetical protein [Streptomyces sichuanensis]